MTTRESITYTGRNGAAVRDWVNDDPGCLDLVETWFITKGMSAATGGQAWHYVKDGKKWPDAVRAAVYDPRTGEWRPVLAGDVIERQGSGYGIRSAS